MASKIVSTVVGAVISRKQSKAQESIIGNRPTFQPDVQTDLGRLRETPEGVLTIETPKLTEIILGTFDRMNSIANVPIATRQQQIFENANKFLKPELERQAAKFQTAEAAAGRSTTTLAAARSAQLQASQEEATARLLEQARAVAFGPYQTKAGQAYIKRGFKPVPMTEAQKRANRAMGAFRRRMTQ